MKRLIILTIVILITCSACTGKKNPENYTGKITNRTENFTYIDSNDEPVINNFLSESNDIQYFNGYLFFFGHTLMKYNVKTGDITSVCQDPLCSHDVPSCPFFGRISNFFIENSKIHYTRYYTYLKNTTSHTVREFGTYNLETMKYKVHNTISGDNYAEYARQLYIDNYRYFYDYIYDEKSDRYIFKISRMDLNTNKTSVLSKQENIVGGITDEWTERFLFTIDNRIYFTDIETIYSTDLDMKDKKIIMNGNFVYDDIFTDGEYIYYGAATDISYVESVHKVNFDGTNDSELGIISNAGGWTITQEYMYYASVFRKTVATPEGEVSLFSDAIIRCDKDGSNKQTVYKADNDEEMGKYIQLTGECIVGNYIYANYYTIDGKSGEYYSNSNNQNHHFMRINMIDNTIEYIYIK